MNRLKCENGDMFGYWKVVDNTPSSKNGHTYIKAQCKCGKVQSLDLNQLVRKKSTGCRNCKAQDRRIPIKIGDVYKEWIVIDGYKINIRQCIIWKVRCTCCNVSTRWIQGNELTNPDSCFCCRKCANKKMFKRTTKERGRVGELAKTRYTHLQKIAQQRNIEFNVSVDYLWSLFIQQNRICAITGDTIENFKQASLDRIDSKIGYIEGNLQWVTKQANLSKHIMTKDEFIIFCQKVINYANQQPSVENDNNSIYEGSETNR